MNFGIIKWIRFDYFSQASSDLVAAFCGCRQSQDGAGWTACIDTANRMNPTSLLRSLSPLFLFPSLVSSALLSILTSELVHISRPCSRTRYRKNNGSDTGSTLTGLQDWKSSPCERWWQHFESAKIVVEWTRPKLDYFGISRQQILTAQEVSKFYSMNCQVVQVIHSDSV